MNSQEKILKDVVNCATTFEKANEFLYNKEYLGDFKLIVKSDEAKALPEYFGCKKFDDAGRGIYSVFLENRFCFLDGDTLTLKATDVNIDYSVSFDTNAFSRLDEWMNNRVQNLETFNEVIMYIMLEGLNIDPVPGIIENASQFQSQKTKSGTKNRLKSWITLKNIDREHYLKHGKVRSILNENESKREYDAYLYLCETFHNTFQDEGYPEYDYPLIFLIRMTEIYMDNNTVPNDRLDKFIDYCTNEFGIQPLRYINIAKLLFNKQDKSIFFKKLVKKIMQKESKENILELLKNMAWDIHHIQWLEDYRCYYSNDNRNNFFIKMIVTLDGGLVEIMNCYPVEALAYSINSRILLPFYGYSNSNSDLIKKLNNVKRSRIAKGKKQNSKILKEEAQNRFLDSSISNGRN